jgi:hypothetical protein
LPPRLTLLLAQWSIAVEHLVLNYGEISTEKCMAFCPSHNKTKNNLRQEKKVSGYN